MSSVGIFVGSLLISRLTSIGSMRTVGAGLLLTGVFSFVVSLNPGLGLIAVALFVASAGNPIYAVANQTALMEAARPSARGSIMASRFGLVQTASVIGVAIGGVITNQFGPTAAYGFLGVGLVILAMYAIAAGRSTTNPLHGAAYEQATSRNGGTLNPHHDDGTIDDEAVDPANDEPNSMATGLHQAKT